VNEERAPVVSVIGSATCSETLAELAEQVGRLLAREGAVLVCGGRGGVMEAACRGARAQGGFTVGILPGRNPSEGNPYLSLALPTGLGESRNTLVATAGQAVIAVGGGLGTLSEIAFALKRGLRVVLLSSSRWQEALEDANGVYVASSPQEAVQKALDSVQK
jgi:uncharacterized protein (TIGR00725 family)